MAENDVIVQLRLLGRALFAAEARRAASDLTPIERHAFRARAALGTMGDTALSAAGSIQSGAAQATRAVAAITAVTGAAAAAAGKVGVSYNAMQDQQMVAFRTFLGSQRQAAAFMRQLQQLALESPVLDPKTTGEGARALMAYGLSAKQTLPFVKALGDMSAASGRSIQEVLPNAARAIGQIASKGKLQTEELNQLAESVGLNRNLIRKELGMTRDEFANAFTPGNTIEARRALPAVLEAMRTQSAGAAQRLAKTTQGRMDQLKEVLSRSLGDFTRPLYNQAGETFGQVARALQDVDLKPAGRRFSRIVQGVLSGAFGGVRRGDFGAQRVGAGIRGAIEGVIRFVPRLVSAVKGVAGAVGGVIGDVIDAFAPARPFLENILLPLLKGVAEGVLGGVVFAFKLALPLIKGVATALGFLGRLAAPVKPVFEGIGIAVGILFGPGLLGNAANVVGRVAGALSGPLQVGLRIVEGAMRGAVIVVKLMGAAMGMVFRGIGRLAGAFARAVQFVGRFAGTFRGAFRTVVTAVTNSIGTVIRLVERGVGGIKTAFERIPRIFKRVWDGMGGTVRNIFNGITSAVSAGMNVLIDIVNEAIGAYNAIPLAPNIGKIGHVGARAQSPDVSGPGTNARSNGRGPTFGQSDAAQSRSTRAAAAASAPASWGSVTVRTMLDSKVLHEGVHRVERGIAEAR